MLESRSHWNAESSRSGRPLGPVADDIGVGDAAGFRYGAVVATTDDDAVDATPPFTSLSDGGDRT